MPELHELYELYEDQVIGADSNKTRACKLQPAYAVIAGSVRKPVFVGSDGQHKPHSPAVNSPAGKLIAC